jgi:ABC-2 type transport system permease protein
MNMYLQEIRAHRKSTVIWTLSLVSIVVLFLALFPSFARDADDFMKVLEDFPEELTRAIGLSFETLASILGFFTYSFLYIKLSGAIQAMNLGISIVSKENRDKTADFLFTKPVTRIQVMTYKLLAAITSLLITNLFFLAAVQVMAAWVSTENYSRKALLMVSATLFFIQLIFLAVGMLIAVAVPRIKSVISVSLGTVFAFFIVGMISSSTEDEGLRYLTPFNYLDENYIINHLSYESAFVFAGAGIAAAALAASYYIYLKKDLHSV